MAHWERILHVAKLNFSFFWKASTVMTSTFCLFLWWFLVWNLVPNSLLGGRHVWQWSHDFGTSLSPTRPCGEIQYPPWKCNLAVQSCIQWGKTLFFQRHTRPRAHGYTRHFIWKDGFWENVAMNGTRKDFLCPVSVIDAKWTSQEK